LHVDIFMKFSIILVESENANEDGFPLYARVSEKQARPKKIIGRAWPEHFEGGKTQMVTDEHPYYGIMAQKILDYKIRAKTLIMSGKYTDPDVVLKEVLQKDTSGITLQEFYASWAAGQKALAAAHEKNGDLKGRNKVNGYVRSIEGAMVHFDLCAPSVAVVGIDSNTIQRFKKQRMMSGNSKSTVALYLRSVRMLYNLALDVHKLPSKKPFDRIFKDLKVKSSQARKKHLDVSAVRVLEALKLGVEHGRARDLFLLQFYFGGCDLTDIYFLKRLQVRKGRVYFERGKTDVIIDLAIHPKAKEIIDRHAAPDGEYLFPWNKDAQFYENFRRRQGKFLIEIQTRQATAAVENKNEALRIDVLPDGGNLAIKVARHTFANTAKGLMIDPDLIRELMGHERDGVDNWYKDRFPAKVRDAALFSVIE